MVQYAAERKKDVRSVNAEQGCSHTELLIVGNSDKLVYLTSRIIALSSLLSFMDKTYALIQVHQELL